jgi:hypothetical protein
MAEDTYNSYKNYVNDMKTVAIGTVVGTVPDAFEVDSYFTSENAVFSPLVGKKFVPGGVIHQVIVLYFRVKYLADLIPNLTDPTLKIEAMQAMVANLEALLGLLPSYPEEVSKSGSVVAPVAGGKNKRQKGGMDTSKIYNAQGLVQELSSMHNSEAVSSAVNFPSPFSANGLAGQSSTIDSLPIAALNALTPPLPTSGGGKKKVKRAAAAKH